MRSLGCARVAQEAGVVDQAKDERVHFAHHLFRIGIRLEVARFHGLQYRAPQRRAPATDLAVQQVAQRSVAVVQLEPSYMDPTAGLARIEELTAEAAGQGATLVVFPELLVPGYPRYVGDPFPHTS